MTLIFLFLLTYPNKLKQDEFCKKTQGAMILNELTQNQNITDDNQLSEDTFISIQDDLSEDLIYCEADSKSAMV